MTEESRDAFLEAKGMAMEAMWKRVPGSHGWSVGVRCSRSCYHANPSVVMPARQMVCLRSNGLLSVFMVVICIGN